MHKVYRKPLHFSDKYCIMWLFGYQQFDFEMNDLQEAVTMEILKVSSHSTPNSVAVAIAGVIREKKVVEVQAVGAGAANQAVKAIAIARGYLAPIGVDLICIPAFANIQIDGEERTAIKLICEER